MQILWPRLTAMPPLGAPGRASSLPSCSAPLPQASSGQCAVAIRSRPLAFQPAAVKTVASARRRQGCRRISIASACRRDLVISADPASSHAATAASVIRPALAPRPPPQLDRLACHRHHATPADSHPSRSRPVEWCRTGPHRCGAFNEGGHRVSLCVIPPRNTQGRNDAMALDQAALSKVLSALKAPRRADTPRRW